MCDYQVQMVEGGFSGQLNFFIICSSIIPTIFYTASLKRLCNDVQMMSGKLWSRELRVDRFHFEVDR